MKNKIEIKFEVNDIVYYTSDEIRKPYIILGIPDTSLFKKEDGNWTEVYIYSGRDNKTNKIKTFVRTKEDFEEKFLKHEF